jgi:hypothetical protein
MNSLAQIWFGCCGGDAWVRWDRQEGNSRVGFYGLGVQYRQDFIIQVSESICSFVLQVQTHGKEINRVFFDEKWKTMKSMNFFASICKCRMLPNPIMTLMHPSNLDSLFNIILQNRCDQWKKTGVSHFAWKNSMILKQLLKKFYDLGNLNFKVKSARRQFYLCRDLQKWPIFRNC